MAPTADDTVDVDITNEDFDGEPEHETETPFDEAESTDTPETQKDKAKLRMEIKRIEERAMSGMLTKVNREKHGEITDFWNSKPKETWMEQNSCVTALRQMNKELGINIDRESITSECVKIATSMGGTEYREAMGKTRGKIESRRMEERAERLDMIADMEAIARDKGINIDAATSITDDRQKYAKLQELLGREGKALGWKDKIKKRGASKIGVGTLRDKMDVSLDIIKNPRTSQSKRATETAKLQSLAASATATGEYVPKGVAAYLAVAKTQETEGIGAEVDTTELDKESKLDSVTGAVSGIGGAFSGINLGRGSRGGTSSELDYDGGGSYSKGGGMNEMFGVASATGGMDTDAMGKGDTPLTDMSQEHGGDEAIHGTMKIKSKVLGKQKVGSGGLFESSMTETKSGVSLSDWSPTAFDTGEKRGEKFLRERGAPTEGEGGPVGGDLRPGSMSLLSQFGKTRPGTKSLDLGAGQFTAATPIDLGTEQRQGQPRASINLGLKQDQKPTTGINILGMSGVRAPDVNSIVKETNVPTNKPMTSGVINQHKKSGLDVGHLIGKTPKKKKKMNLFGGLPR